MVADDQWWRKQAVLIDFGQIETLGAFWRKENWQGHRWSRKSVGLD